MTINTNQLKNHPDKPELTNSDRKEATIEMNEDTKQRLKEEMRNSLSACGPGYIPSHLKDPNYVYEYAMLDTQRPYKFMSKLNLGYQHVTHDMMPLFKEYVGSYQGGFSIIDEGGKIGIKSSPHETLYMVRIPKERYAIIEELREEKRQEPVKAMMKKPDTGNFFGEIAIGSGNFTTQPPQK